MMVQQQKPQSTAAQDGAALLRSNPLYRGRCDSMQCMRQRQGCWRAKWSTVHAQGTKAVPVLRTTPTMLAQEFDAEQQPMSR